MKKILITGTAGFIGYHLCHTLIKEGLSIIGLDNINDYYDVNLKYARLNETGINKELIVYGRPVVSETYGNYKFIQLNLEDLENLRQLFDKEKFDCVINLAAQAGVRYSIQNPYAYLNSNLYGFLNILECCRHFSVKHLLYASSSSVYGTNSKIPFNETDRTDTPVSLYAATKKSNELFAFTYSHLFNIQTTGLRFFTVYGPWGRPDMAYYKFTENILNEKPIQIFNNGNMERDFTYVDDVVDGLIQLLKNQDSIDVYNIFNIGNNHPENLMKMISLIEKNTDKECIKQFTAMQPGDVERTYADIERMNSKFVFQPKTSLENGLKNFIDWFIQYQNKAYNTQKIYKTSA